MTTYDATGSTSAAVSARGVGRVYTVEATFDATEFPLAQNDIAQLIPIKANTLVQGIFWEVETVEGASRNFAIGDGSDTDGFITTTTGNTLAAGHSIVSLTEGTPNTVTGYSAGKFYSAADTIDILAVTSGGLTALKLRVVAQLVDYNSQDQA